MKKNKKVSIEPSNMRQTMASWMRYWMLSDELFNEKKPEIFNITDLSEDSEFLDEAKCITKDLKLDWDHLTHDESNRIMLALLSSDFMSTKNVENVDNLQINITLKAVRGMDREDRMGVKCEVGNKPTDWK